MSALYSRAEKKEITEARLSVLLFPLAVSRTPRRSIQPSASAEHPLPRLCRKSPRLGIPRGHISHQNSSDDSVECLRHALSLSLLCSQRSIHDSRRRPSFVDEQREEVAQFYFL
jgi:hypothetical protein